MKPIVQETSIETRMLPEWLYVRMQLDFENQPPSVRAFIDSFMNCINDKVNPNEILNVIAHMSGMAVQMMCSSDGMTPEQLHQERTATVNAVAASLPEIFQFHSTQMPETVEAILKDLQPQGMFVANDSELPN